MVHIKDDLGTTKVKNIAFMIGTLPLYVIHLLSQLKIVEEILLSL